MGLRDKLFGQKRPPQQIVMPAILEPEDPVNYNTVLDWLLGLSDKDYKVMLDVVDVYRTANKSTAKLLKVKDEPTTQLKPVQQTDEEIDADLDTLLVTDPEDLKAAIAAEKPKTTAKKAQPPSNDKKVKV